MKDSSETAASIAPRFWLNPRAGSPCVPNELKTPLEKKGKALVAQN